MRRVGLLKVREKRISRLLMILMIFNYRWFVVDDSAGLS